MRRMSIYLQIFLLSAVPLIEQRGAIPLGFIHGGVHPLLIFVLAVAGSMLPVPFILLLVEKVYAWMEKYPKFSRIIKMIDKKVATNQHKFDKYKEIALITFVAIPLPTTGLWTGSLIAAFLKFDFKRSMLCMLLGGIGSATIITIICIVAPQLFGLVAG
jgi:uncharacterized membrane protein